MSRFDRINEAVEAFALADGVGALQRAIVEQVGRMGYQRARLYEYDPVEKKLYGRTSIGFSDRAHAEAFTRHVIDSEKEGEVRNTIDRSHPGLFIYADAPWKEPRSDLVHYCPRGADAELLEKTGVNRWMEAPLRIPEVDVEGRRSVRPWGKISVDLGPPSDGLSPRDVADLSLLAAVASGALVEKIRAGRDEVLLTTYEEDTRRLERAERPPGDERVMPQIMGWLLELFRKMFAVDLALYREYRPEERTLACTQGASVRRAADCLPPGASIPEEVRIEDYPSYERFGAGFVDDEGAVIDPDVVKHYAHNHHDQVVRLSPAARDKLSAEENRYLEWIQSEIGIPIVVRNKVRGVIVGISGRPDIFPPDCHTALRRFRSVAQLWFQFGELHDALTSAISTTLGDCLKAWSLLQGEDEPKVHAGLAAILTAGCGLGWHRALIFRNIEATGTGAELVHAVGGLGEKEHRKIQEYVEKTEGDLVALVRKRIEDTRPHGPDGDGDRVDSLYRRYLEGAEPRPRIFYAEDARLGTLQHQAQRQERAPFLELDRGDTLIQSLNQRYPDLFPAGTTYLFPLYSNMSEAEHQGPLGFIAIDNAYRPNPHEEMALALTAAIVELARDEVAARLRYRLWNGMLGALPFLRHGPEIGTKFAGFNQALYDLLPALRGAVNKAGDNPKLVAARQAWADLNEAVEKMAKAQEHVKSLELPEKVGGLKAHLLRVIKDWEETRNAHFVVQRLELEAGLRLDCDTAILDGALRCVLENAASVSRRDAHGRFRVELRAASRADVPGFKAMVTIEVTDDGPGIDPRKEQFLFIDGFTDREDLAGAGSPQERPDAHRGLGLGMARAFLLRSHGELRLQHRGGDGRGATFALHLGIPAPRSPIIDATTEHRP